MSKINIVEKEVLVKYNVKSFDIVVSGIILGECVNIYASCYDIDNNFLYKEYININGQEYLDWGTDDNYLINIVAQRLGFVIENI